MYVTLLGGNGIIAIVVYLEMLEAKTVVMAAEAIAAVVVVSRRGVTSKAEIHYLHARCSYDAGCAVDRAAEQVKIAGAMWFVTVKAGEETEGT